MPEDIITLLTQDHDEARRLLKRLETATGDDAVRTLEKLREAMVKHSRAEEELVYPFYKECIGTKEAKVDVVESRSEHENVDRLLDELVGLSPSSAQYKGRMKFLKESIEHHAGDEERGMFPQMRKNCPPDQLQELATEFRRRKQEISVPSPGTEGQTRDELYKEAQQQGIQGRSGMDKQELQEALRKDH